MGAESYFGRVGGLAVALGVGTAVATGHGVAAADDTDNPAPENPSTSDTSPVSGSTGTKSTPTPATGTKSTSPSSTRPSTEPRITPETSEKEKATTSSSTDPASSTQPTETPKEPESPKEPEPTTAPTEVAEPTKTPDPQPTQTPEAEEPTESSDTQDVPTPDPLKSNNRGSEPSSVIAPSTSISVRHVESFTDPAATVQSADPVAVFVDARALAAASPRMVSPMMAAQFSTVETPQPRVAAAPQDPLTTVTNLVSSVVKWVLDPLAGTAPTAPAQPPLIWSLLAFARREFENFFAAVGGRSTENTAATQTTSLALAAAAVPTPPRVAPGFPLPGAQLSPSTRFVNWVTGNYYSLDPANDPLDWPNTLSRYYVYGTDVGTMWDNGIPDDPRTPINEHQVLIAVGDTFGGPNSAGWRPNTIFRSSDTDLTNGMLIPAGQWFNGNMFGGAPLGPNSTTARQSIFPDGLPAGVTLIPTAGISLPTPGTTFGATQYLSFMSVTQWGASGSWTTNYSAIAYSTDNGENWKVAPTSVRYNQPWTGNQNFQQSAFVRPGDGYVYMYGTPNGRQGAAYVSRVLEKDILDVTKFEYYRKAQSATTPAGWVRNNPAAATPVFGQEGGACGVASAGNTVSEMSVQYNKQLKKYVVLYGDQNNNIVMRTSDTPQGTWSAAKVVMAQQNGGIYAPMMHPWSPSTMGTGTDLYWNLSLWSQYNVMLMRTDLSKV
jgi:hypothetical protein